MEGFLTIFPYTTAAAENLFFMCEGRYFVQLSFLSTVFKYSGKLHCVDW
jgi:hypothetical protein